MNTNVNQFRQHLKSENIVLEEGELADQEIYFAIEETIRSGPRVRIIAIFSNDEHQVLIIGARYVNVDNPLKKEFILAKLNELNAEYNYLKFYMTPNNEISVSVSLPFNNNFNAGMVWAFMVDVFRTMEKEYKGFMRIMWS